MEPMAISKSVDGGAAQSYVNCRRVSFDHSEYVSIVYLAVVQITLEDDEVRAREVEEQIRSFVVQLPEREAGAPERMLFVDPLALLLVLLY